MTTELNGTISMRPLQAADGALAGITISGSPHGTVVDLEVPVHDE